MDVKIQVKVGNIYTDVTPDNINYDLSPTDWKQQFIISVKNGDSYGRMELLGSEEIPAELMDWLVGSFPNGHILYTSKDKPGELVLDGDIPICKLENNGCFKSIFDTKKKYSNSPKIVIHSDAKTNITKYIRELLHEYTNVSLVVRTNSDNTTVVLQDTIQVPVGSTLELAFESPVVMKESFRVIAYNSKVIFKFKTDALVMGDGIENKPTVDYRTGFMPSGIVLFEGFSVIKLHKTLVGVTGSGFIPTIAFVDHELRGYTDLDLVTVETDMYIDDDLIYTDSVITSGIKHLVARKE